jgi:hypothetical protein
MRIRRRMRKRGRPVPYPQSRVSFLQSSSVPFPLLNSLKVMLLVSEIAKESYNRGIKGSLLIEERPKYYRDKRHDRFLNAGNNRPNKLSVRRGDLFLETNVVNLTERAKGLKPGLRS